MANRGRVSAGAMSAEEVHFPTEEEGARWQSSLAGWELPPLAAAAAAALVVRRSAAAHLRVLLISPSPLVPNLQGCRASTSTSSTTSARAETLASVRKTWRHLPRSSCRTYT